VIDLTDGQRAIVGTLRDLLDRARAGEIDTLTAIATGEDCAHVVAQGDCDYEDHLLHAARVTGWLVGRLDGTDDEDDSDAPADIPS
jgi:hypothetical protein